MVAKFILDGVDNRYRDLDKDNTVLIYREKYCNVVTKHRLWLEFTVHKGALPTKDVGV